MKKVLITVSIILIFSATVCGFWLASQETIEQSSANFHMFTALGGVLLAFSAFFVKGKTKNNAK